MGDTPGKSRDGMSTRQNGAAAYSQSHVFAGVVWFPVVYPQLEEGP